MPPAPQANGFGTTYGAPTQVPTSTWGGNSAAVTDTSGWGAVSPPTVQQTPSMGDWGTMGPGETAWGGTSSYGNGS